MFFYQKMAGRFVTLGLCFTYNNEYNDSDYAFFKKTKIMYSLSPSNTWEASEEILDRWGGGQRCSSERQGENTCLKMPTKLLLPNKWDLNSSV